MPNQFRIFISYAKVDTPELAFQLRDRFNALPGVEAWMDESLESGEDWAVQIQDKIDHAGLVVVLLSQDVNRPANHPKGQSFVLREIHYAQQARKPIIPVLALPTRVPVQLAGIEHIDLTKDLDAGMNRLLQQVSRRAGNPTPAIGTRPTTEETQRRLDAATPSETQISTKTEIEVRVKIVQSSSGGLKDELPAVAISGDIIHKHNVVPSNFPIQFEEDDFGHLFASLCIKVQADGFKVRSDFSKGECGGSAVALEISPNMDSATIIFFLSPKAIPQPQSVRIRVSVLQKGKLIAQVPLQTELVKQVQRFSITDYWNLISAIFTEKSTQGVSNLDLPSSAPAVGTAFLPSAPHREPPARAGMSDTLKAAIITGIFAVFVAVVTIVPNLLPKAAETPTPSPTNAAVIAPSNTPPPTDAPTATDIPSATPVPPTATPTATAVPPSTDPSTSSLISCTSPEFQRPLLGDEPPDSPDWGISITSLSQSDENTNSCDLSPTREKRERVHVEGRLSDIFDLKELRLYLLIYPYDKYAYNLAYIDCNETVKIDNGSWSTEADLGAPNIRYDLVLIVTRVNSATDTFLQDYWKAKVCEQRIYPIFGPDYPDNQMPMSEVWEVDSVTVSTGS